MAHHHKKEGEKQVSRQTDWWRERDRGVGGGVCCCRVQERDCVLQPLDLESGVLTTQARCLRGSLLLDLDCTVTGGQLSAGVQPAAEK